MDCSHIGCIITEVILCRGWLHIQTRDPSAAMPKAGR